MKLYHLYRKQVLPISPEEAWRFFCSPKNLAKITPPYMNFRIDHISGEGRSMYTGQLVSYRVQIMPGISVFWMTEFTHVDAPRFFADEQKFGPFKLWNHQHFFKEVDGGVEMTDEITYVIPFGVLGQLVNWMFVGRRVKAIFDYRFETVNQIFESETKKNQHAL
jgi:ligand-binding SRPBCC domain-containing protein